MIFPNGGPLPRHPSQRYEAAPAGVVRFIVLGLLVRSGWLKRPGVVTGAFALGSIPGAAVGSRVAQRLPAQAMKRGFGVLLIVFAIYFIARQALYR